VDTRNAEEETVLTLRGIKRSFGDLRTFFPFHIAARTIFCTDAGRAFEVPLSFYRRGYVQSKNRQHVDAFYNFFLFIETSFGGGQFKKTGLIKAFMGSRELVLSVLRARAAFLQPDVARRYFHNPFANFLQMEKDPKKILEWLVDRRGFLHHHSSKRKQNWHPDNQQEFAAEEEFLQHVCHYVGIDRVTDVMFTDEVTSDLLCACERATAMLRMQMECTLALEDGSMITKDRFVSWPATKITRQLVREVFIHMLENSESAFPGADLVHITLKTEDGHQIIGSFRNLAP
jgi:hypothetical protein